MTAVLSLGSNLGDRRGHLRAALAVLRPTVVSSVWQTAPVGGPPQDDFLNLVALVEDDATKAWVLAQRAEREAGRQRSVRWGPRSLDVDVVTASPPVPQGLVIPHPRAHQRAFVLAPWLEVEPAAVLPGHGAVAALLHALGTAGVHRVEGL